MTIYLEPYLAGEYEQVWSELVAQGNRVRDEPLYSDALAVARETMRRAKHNIELLVQRLTAIGYVFAHPERVFIEPAGNVASQINDLERLVGTIPLSLRAWYETIGSVCLSGSHPTLASYIFYDRPAYMPHPQRSNIDGYSDPLVVFSLNDILEEMHIGIEHGNLLQPKEDRICLDISNDLVHKSNQSGGPPYCIRVPDAAIDGLLEYELHEIYFVEYLRLSFQWGGFPGFDLYGKTELFVDPNGIHEEEPEYFWDPAEIPREELARLSEGLLPI